MATILIVDDQPANRAYLVKLLGYAGHRLPEAADGAEALTQAMADPPDLVIADIVMPTMDGFEFVRRLRADPALAHTQVIFYTAAYNEWEIRSTARACGVAHILTKPAAPQVILDIVNAALGLSAVPAAPPAPESFTREHLRLLTDKLSQKVTELEATSGRLAALLALGQELVAERDPQRLIEHGCQGARAIIGASYAAVSILAEDGQMLHQFAISGLDGETIARMSVPAFDQGAIHTIITERRALRRHNPSGDPQALGLPHDHPPAYSFLGVPIVTTTRFYGWLGLRNKLGLDEFSAADEQLAMTLAAQLALAYENALRDQQIQRHAAELEQEIAERKRAEASLRESEARYRQLLEVAPIGIAVHSEGKLVFANPAGAGMLGANSPQDLVGKPLSAVVHPAAWAAAGERIQRMLAGEQGLYPVEDTYIRADGTAFPVEVVAAGLTYQGQPAVQVIVTDITERKRAEEALRRRAEELAALNTSALAITMPHDLPSLLQAIVERAVQLLEASGGTLYLCDPEQQEVHCVVAFRTRRDYIGTVFRYGEGAAGLVAQTGQPLIVDDYRSWPGRAAVYEEEQPSSAVLSVPMIWQGQVTGVIHVLREPTMPHFTPADLELLTQLANHAAIAVANARLLEAEQHARAIAETLRAANLALTATLDLDTVLATLLEYLQQIILYDSANVMLLEDDTRFVVAAVRGYERWTDPAQTRAIAFDAATNPLFRALLTERQSVLISDTNQHPHWERPAGAEHVLSWLGVPLVAGGAVIGLYSLDKIEPGFFTAAHVRLAEALAAQAAVAIQNARLLKQVQRHLQELTAIHRAGQQLQTLLEPEVLAQELISVLEEMLGYEYSAVLLVDESSGQLIPFALSDQGRGATFVEVDKSAVATHALHLGVGITGWVAQTGQSVCMGDVRRDPRYYGLRDDIRSELCVPLRAGDQIIGVVNVETPQLNAYTETDQHVLETVATQIATAIQNARLLEQVLASRERLQALSQRLVELQEAERRQIARELHDEVGQVLTGLKLTLDMAARLPPAQVAGRLDEARGVLNDLMARVRNLSLDLRPTMLDDMGLLPALQWHFERYTGQTGIQVLCRHNGLDRRFPADAETAVYRIVQEALTNAARYADVREVSVRLLADQEWMRVRIDDQGRGFDLDHVRTMHTTSGLTGMHERALLLGGELTIESTPGGGTHVIAELPMTT